MAETVLRGSDVTSAHISQVEGSHMASKEHRDAQAYRRLLDHQWSIWDLLSNAPHLADLTTTKSLVPDCSWIVRVYCRTK